MNNYLLNPLVSIIIPCFNAEDFVELAIRSIMEQSYSNMEIIVLNDQSTDNTGKILKKLASEDSRIIYIENEKNIKLVDTLNKGLLLCNGKYIARMDADDVSRIDRIQKQVEFLEKNPDIAILGSAMQIFGEGIKEKELLNPTKHERIIAKMFVASPLFHPTIMIRKELVDNGIFKYDKNFFRVEDYHLWVKLSTEKVKFANLPDVLLDYRFLTNSETRLGEKNLAERIESHSKIYEIIFHNNNISLNKDEIYLYTKTMSKNWIDETISLNCILKIYNKIINQSENKLIKEYLAKRWIYFLFKTQNFSIIEIKKIITSFITYIGIYSIIKDKFK